MKFILTTTILLFSIFSYSQNYKLFNADSRKVYTNFPVPDSTFSIAFDSVRLVGTDSVYYNFTQTGNSISSESCQFWGAPECTKQDRPTWLGSGIKYDNESTYTFFTQNNESLIFDFSKMDGNPVLFYQNATEKFYYNYVKSDTLTIMSFVDSTKFFTITHTDISGNTINSSLNGSRIISAKTLGLIQFFQVDEFPDVLNPVYILGNQSPDLGLAKITNEMLYDYNIGDEIQEHVIQWYNYPSPDNYDRYIKYTFLSKTLTADSLFYQAERYVFDKGSLTSTEDVVELKYATHDQVAMLPFDYITPDYFFNTHKLYFEYYCGDKMWTYRETRNRGLRYCNAENCWGSNDVPGPAPQEETIYTFGLGIYYSIYADAFITPPPSMDYSIAKTIIYFKKNGITCGMEAMLGLDENKTNETFFTLYPVPATDLITVETSHPKGSWLSISYINGMEISKQQISGTKTQIDISQLKKGIYLVKLITGKSVLVKKLVKE